MRRRKVRTIEVKYHHETEGWWAESGDLPGWSVAAPDLRALRHLVRESVAFTLGAKRSSC